MKSIIVDGRFYRSVRAYAEASGTEYHRIIIAHVHAGGSPYFFQGQSVRLATEAEAESCANGDNVDIVPRAAVVSARSFGPLIPHPITCGIGSNWGNY